MTRPFDREPDENAPSAPPGVDEDAYGLYACVLRDLERRVSAFVLRGFFEPLVPLALEGDVLTLGAPSKFHADWVKDHYLDEIARTAGATAGRRLAVMVIEHHGPEKPVTAREQDVLPPAPVVKLPVRATAASSSSASAPARLNPAHTFETFVCGPSNRMAYAACSAVADEPAQRYSPLFLFGKTGLGKTHLLHAIGNAARAKDPSLRVVYMSAEQWVNEYITEIRRQRFDEFRARYRAGCDLLLIDDIQFLAGKDASQDEFFHTFNSLYESRRQIVVTADRYPHEIEGLEQRLQTRLAWGLIADIQPPEVETRVAILERKAEQLGLAITPDVFHFLADHIKSSVRALEGALVRLQAYAGITRTPISLSLAKDVLRPVLPLREDLSVERILSVVTSYYDVRVKDVLGKSRQRTITMARQMAMYLARKHTGASLPEIGRAFGRDHTTALASIRKIAGLLATDAGTQAVITRLENDLL